MAVAKPDNKIKHTPDARRSVTYWEAIYELHQKGLISHDSAEVIAYIFGREIEVVKADLLKGVP